MITDENVSDFVGLLPRKLQLRFEALGGYVRAIIAGETETDVNLGRQISRQHISFIHLVVFVYSLDGFLRDGTRAARGAVSVFDDLGAKGFSVGSTLFTATNENTLRGEHLANKLRSSIVDVGLLEILQSCRSMKELVLRLMREVRNGQPNLG